MSTPLSAYQIERLLTQYFANLRPAQQRGLAWWVYGTLLAQSACQNAVVTALQLVGSFDRWRQYLREWLYDGADKAAPNQVQVEVRTCFGPLLRWVLAWWQGDVLPLAVDATTRRNHLTVLALSVLYRGTALPVAWLVFPGNQPGSWMEALLPVIADLGEVTPTSLTVLLLADRGLWSPRLWRAAQAVGWHPLVRVPGDIVFTPQQGTPQRATRLIAGPGHAWVGRGVAFRDRARQQVGTLVVVWAVGQREPWVVLTDLAPRQVGVSWYALRMSIELGFRVLKSAGWQWQRTRRTDPLRAARHWLVLAVATLVTVACGTWLEDAQAAGVPPWEVEHAPAGPAHRPRRASGTCRMSVFRLGLLSIVPLLQGTEPLPHWWLRLEALPEPPAAVQITWYAPDTT